MDKQNLVQQINEIKNILSYSANIGFFFGAGTSCAFGLPDIGELTKQIKEKLDSKEEDIFNRAADMVEEIHNIETANVEDILNYIRQIRELTKDSKKYRCEGISGEDAANLDKSICKAIFQVIKENEDGADISEIRKFIAWYDSVNRSNYKEIYTTNYDMLLEMAMEQNYTPYIDGFAGSYEPFFCPESIEHFPKKGDLTEHWIRLWKIHGSLNWMKDGQRIIRVGKIEDPDNELMIYPSKEKYHLSRKEPFIAYFDRLKKYLLSGEIVLICSGYSFSDQHINDIIYNALQQNPKLFVLVFCYSETQIDSMEANATAHMNLCVMAPKRIIKNGTVRKWDYSDIEEKGMSNSPFWDDTKKEFKLGDFKEMIDFLIENSGYQHKIEEKINGK